MFACFFQWPRVRRRPRRSSRIRPLRRIRRSNSRSRQIRSRMFRRAAKSSAACESSQPESRKQSPRPSARTSLRESISGSAESPSRYVARTDLTKKGDVYDEEAIHRDFISLGTLAASTICGLKKRKVRNGGIILRFVVTERRTVHTIDYTGNKSISKSEILDRFKDRHVNLSPESQFDPGKVQRAKNVLQDYEAERGHQYATVTPQIRQVPPGGVDITFAIDEGPKVKVGNIIIEGNHAFSDRDVIRRDEEPEAHRDPALVAF